MNLQRIGSIPSYSLPIVSVFGSSKYDLIVAIDIQHNVFYHSLRNQHFIHSFKLHHCPNDANHIIRMVNDPLICILSTSPYNETKSFIEFFDLIGSRVKVIETDGKVLSFDTISTNSSFMQIHIRKFISMKPTILLS